jgi:TetR/AcrR family transcriptional regulator, mexJK operon transcriptional repressor
MTKRRVKTKPRAPGRPSAEETTQLEARLVDAAETVFLDHGFARTTMDAIAKAGGVTRKTLYARYANKEKIFAAVIARLLDTPAARPEPPASRMNMHTLFLKVAKDLIAMAETPRTAALSRLIYAEAHQAPELVRLSEEIYLRALAPIVHALKMLRATGKAPTLPPDEIAGPLFMEMVVSTPRSRAILGAPLPRQQVSDRTEAAVQHFLRGCGYHS